ncbi:MFS transporter [Streptomyces marincola]|nr:MFS transporter [Streptomyces marincola]
MTHNPSPPASEPVADDTSLGARGWMILVTLCSATFVVGLDFSIVAVALPEIGSALGFAGTGDLQWVVTACLLPTASLLLLFGRLSDRMGRRNLFLLGLLLLVITSLIAGLAGNPGTLVAARAGQGIAGAMISPTALALLTTVFPEGPQRTKALGINGALLSLGFVVGTIGGGVITSAFNWRWTMLIMAIVGAAVLVSGLAVLSADRERTRRALDVPGAVLVSGGLFALVYWVSTGADNGWGSGPTVAALVLAVLLLGAFLLVERRHPSPLVPLSLLNRPSIKWGWIVGLITFGMCGGTTVLLSLYMQEILGWSALETGFGFLAEGLGALVSGLIVSRLIGAWGGPRTLVVGLGIQAVGTAAMVVLPNETNLPLLLLTSGAMGFGHVLAVVAFINAMTSGLRDDEQGVVGGLAQMPQFVGAIGTAALAAIASSRTAALESTRSAVDAHLGGLHAGMLAGGLVCLAGVLITVLFLRRPAAPPDGKSSADANEPSLGARGSGPAEVAAR